MLNKFKLNPKPLNSIEELLKKHSNVDYSSKKDRESKSYVSYINNLAVAFDIETSSFTDYKGEKAACMYEWTLGIDGDVIVGRTWDEFIYAINKIVEFYELNTSNRLIIYVHNLAYEFQWIQYLFKWRTIFAKDERKPMKALTMNGIEFRCSYMLSGKSLELTGSSLTKYKVNKKVGDLDYDKTRHSKTPLTKEEWDYCIYDVLVTMAYIREEIESHNDDLTNIELTSTGKVRTYCRQKCFNDFKDRTYYNMIHQLGIRGCNEYYMLKRAFQGGFTHANAYKVGKIYENVASYDFTSSYPACLFLKEYPTSSSFPVEIKDINDLKEKSKKYCLIFDVEIDDLTSTFKYENYLSLSKCYEVEEPSVNNGRLESAKHLKTTVTQIDFEIMCKCYDLDDTNVKFGKCIGYFKGYLPKKIINCVIDFYVGKTTLKDVEGKESEYQYLKGLLNSIYGDFVLDPITEDVEYNNDWSHKKIALYTDDEITNKIRDYNKNKNRYNFYPWGIFCTACARRNLWTGILKIGEDYIYSDTDSVKITNHEKYKDYFEKYNKWIVNELEKCCDNYHLDKSLIKPKTVKGVEKPLGVWDFEGVYKKFKTLGAKRYLVVKEDGKIVNTIAGVSKREGKKFFNEYLPSLGKDPFEEFNDYLCVPEDYSGRKICYYSKPDEEIEGEVVDYLGNVGIYHEKSWVHMSKGDYNLTLSPLYKAFLVLINGEEIKEEDMMN